jgi:hypothetical protein
VGTNVWEPIFKTSKSAGAMPPKLCEQEGTKQAVSGSTPLCKAHGWGKRCKDEHCFN